MNWGHKLTIVISLFIIGMLTLVFIASKQTNEMMDEKYYEKELAYQSVIDAKKNLAIYTINTLVTQNDSVVNITFPIKTIESNVDGTIDFIRVESKKNDITFKLNVNNQGIQSIQKNIFIKGWYKMRIRWKSNNKEYFNEENIKI